MYTYVIQYMHLFYYNIYPHDSVENEYGKLGEFVKVNTYVHIDFVLCLV